MKYWTRCPQKSFFAELLWHSVMQWDFKLEHEFGQELQGQRGAAQFCWAYVMTKAMLGLFTGNAMASVTASSSSLQTFLQYQQCVRHCIHYFSPPYNSPHREWLLLAHVTEEKLEEWRTYIIYHRKGCKEQMQDSNPGWLALSRSLPKES